MVTPKSVASGGSSEISGIAASVSHRLTACGDIDSSSARLSCVIPASRRRVLIVCPNVIFVTFLF